MWGGPSVLCFVEEALQEARDQHAEAWTAPADLAKKCGGKERGPGCLRMCERFIKMCQTKGSAKMLKECNRDEWQHCKAAAEESSRLRAARARGAVRRSLSRVRNTWTCVTRMADMGMDI